MLQLINSHQSEFLQLLESEGDEGDEGLEEMLGAMGAGKEFYENYILFQTTLMKYCFCDVAL